MKLDGSVALVTGGAKRVGRAIVLELARSGCNVAIHYRHSESDAHQLAQEVIGQGRQAIALAGELNDPNCWAKLIQQTVDQFGGLNILVNNASLFLADTPDSVDDFDAGLWERMLRTNLVAPMALCHHARRHLEANGRGKIVNLCDICSERPWPQHLSYCSSKAALACLTKGLARALAPTIQVTGVAPGIAVFPDSYSKELRQRLTGRVPAGRPGTPEEVARLVRFLVESGDYMTGQVLSIDGGRSLV